MAQLQARDRSGTTSGQGQEWHNLRTCAISSPFKGSAVLRERHMRVLDVKSVGETLNGDMIQTFRELMDVKEI